MNIIIFEILIYFIFYSLLSREYNILLPHRQSHDYICIILYSRVPPFAPNKKKKTL